MNVTKILAVVVVMVAALYELIVQGLGLAWFWGGFSNCARIIALFPILALVAGLVAIAIPHARATMGILIVSVVFMLLGVAGGISATSRSEIPCGAPVQITYSWLFFIILGLLATWSIWRLITGKRPNSESRTPSRMT
jgi:hypothetical protein